MSARTSSGAERALPAAGEDTQAVRSLPGACCWLGVLFAPAPLRGLGATAGSDPRAVA